MKRIKQKVVLSLMVIALGADNAASAHNGRAIQPYGPEQLGKAIHYSIIRHMPDAMSCVTYATLENGTVINPPTACFEDTAGASFVGLKGVTLVEKGSGIPPSAMLLAWDKLPVKDFWQIYTLFYKSSASSLEKLLKTNSSNPSVKLLARELAKIRQ